MLKKVVLAMGCALSLLACEAAPWDVVDAFLGASRDGDLATLAMVSVVGWPGAKVKARDIEAWWVIQVTTSQVEPFQLEERQRRLNAARAARDARMKETDEGEDTELQRIQSRVERLRVRVERERGEARKSVETWAPIDGFRGDVEIRQVEVIVRSPSGDRRYALTLKRYRLSCSPNESQTASWWIVTAIESVDG